MNNNETGKSKYSLRKSIPHLIFGLIILFVIKSMFFAPKPVIISKFCDDLSTNVFALEYSAQAKGKVINNGSSGDIVIEVIMHQANNKWRKSEILHLNENETRSFKIVFDEVELVKGDIYCEYITYQDNFVLKFLSKYKN